MRVFAGLAHAWRLWLPLLLLGILTGCADVDYEEPGWYGAYYDGYYSPYYYGYYGPDYFGYYGGFYGYGHHHDGFHHHGPFPPFL